MIRPLVRGRRGLIPRAQESDPLRSCGFRGLSLALVLGLTLPAVPAHALRTQAGLEGKDTAATLTTALTAGAEEVEQFALPDDPRLSDAALQRDFDQALSPVITAYQQGLAALQASRYADAVLAFTTAKQKWPVIAHEVSGWPMWDQADREEITTYLDLAAAQTATALAFAKLRGPATLADVRQALAALDGLKLQIGRRITPGAAVFLGEAVAGAVVMHRMVSNLPAPTAAPYAAVTDPAMARQLLDNRLLPAPPNHRNLLRVRP
ncbi:MAG: hypothetical protein HY600_06165 [Candidatus Omnitrophica bacterium]|nr:hypothetical protein [Candidatus Omnitrophota bacterium]